MGAYFDLESPEDRSKLSNVEQTLRGKQDRLVVLDEVQRLPTLFEPLRGLIDHARRDPQGGRKTGLYLRGHQAGQEMGDLSGG